MRCVDSLHPGWLAAIQVPMTNAVTIGPVDVVPHRTGVLSPLEQHFEAPLEAFLDPAEELFALDAGPGQLVAQVLLSSRPGQLARI